jgi:glycosyltransferase involved in cell wall biosynthesis
MRICVISPGVVHAIPRTVAIVDHFDEVHFVDVPGKADRATLESHGVIYHGPEETGDAPITSRQLSGLLRRIEPDAIVCHFSSGDHFFSAVAYGRCPIAVIAMGNDVLYDEGDCFVPHFMRLLIRMGLRRSHYISAKSEHLAERIKSYRVRAFIDVNYWGADLTVFQPGNQIEARRVLGLDARKRIILSSRALEPRLNIHLVVEAFHTVSKEYPDTLLVLLGRSEPGYKRQVVETIARLNLGEKVSIVGDVSQAVLPLYYQASDVVVSMAHCEGFPNTLLEVMASKVPIVVGRISQIEELLENGKNAWICEKEPQAIAAAILDVLDNQDRRQQIANAAYLSAREHADIKMNGVKFSNSIKRYCAACKHSPYMKIILFRILYTIYRVQRKIIKI